jgi:hypothetical protein
MTLLRFSVRASDNAHRDIEVKSDHLTAAKWMRESLNSSLCLYDGSDTAIEIRSELIVEINIAESG